MSQNLGKVKEGYSGMVGTTPLVKLVTLSNATGCNILAKADHLNPGGSVKDRAAKYMIESAIKEGKLQPGGTIVEATAGNTGIGLLLNANCLGYKCYFVCPDKVSQEKIEYLRNLGAEVEVTATVGYNDPRNFMRVAEVREKELNGFYTNQFKNENNFRAHYETSGPEIWDGTDGKVDAFVSAAGTAGTIGGVSVYLKEHNPAVKCFLVDPPGSGLKFEVKENKMTYRLKTDEEKKEQGSIIEGIGVGREDFYGLTRAKIDGVIKIPDTDAVEMVHYLIKKEGLFVGPSAALNVIASLKVAQLLGPGHTIVTVLCDGGNNYKSKVFNKEFLEEKKIFTTKTTLEEFIQSYDPNCFTALLK